MRKVVFLITITLISLSLTGCLKGNSWEVAKTFTDGELPNGVSSGSFLDQDYGVAINSEQVFTTEDGGLNWTEEEISVICLGYVNVLDTEKFVVASACSGAFLFNETGMTRVTKMGTSTYSTQESNNGWLVMDGGRSIINHNSETADVKNKIRIKGSNKLKAVHKISDTVGYAADILGNLYKTVDSGKNWEQTPMNLEGVDRPMGTELLTDIKFIGESDIRVITYRRRFIEEGMAWYYYSSSDSGLTWSGEEIDIEGLPAGEPYISKDGKTITITLTSKAKEGEPKMYILNYVGEDV